MTWMEWYDSLAKPSWTPAPGTISTIWMCLYPLIALTFGFVFVQAFRGRLPWRVAAPFAVNLATNLLFMPLFSGLRSIPLATLDIVAVGASLAWAMAAVWPHHRWVALAQLPYLAWISVALVIQVCIFAWNR
ncbi:MAG: tryptophan-rich sensory protein [Gemmataceae bacterium]|nr:tryptophan-rich sensory protein [Gemmataceae bacterium]